MEEQQAIQFRLMTYNIGGGRRDFGSILSRVIEVIKEASPDILVVQEATEFQDAEGAWHSDLSQIARLGNLGGTSTLRQAFPCKSICMCVKPCLFTVFSAIGGIGGPRPVRGV